MEKEQEFLLKNSCWKELKENLNSVVIDYHPLCYEEASHHHSNSNNNYKMCSWANETLHNRLWADSFHIVLCLVLSVSSSYPYNRQYSKYVEHYSFMMVCCPARSHFHPRRWLWDGFGSRVVECVVLCNNNKCHYGKERNILRIKNCTTTTSNYY